MTSVGLEGNVRHLLLTVKLISYVLQHFLPTQAHLVMLLPTRVHMLRCSRAYVLRYTAHCQQISSTNVSVCFNKHDNRVLYLGAALVHEPLNYMYQRRFIACMTDEVLPKRLFMCCVRFTFRFLITKSYM